MNWVLMYLMMAFTGNAPIIGMTTTGIFANQLDCETYAAEVWSTDNWTQEPDEQNYYDSRLVIHHLEHKDSNMAVFYTCAPMREPRESYVVCFPDDSSYYRVIFRICFSRKLLTTG